MVTTASISVLERTRATRFVPGSNRRGEALGASWTLLLDDLALGHVVCLGVPGERSLRTLARHARTLTLVCADRRASRVLRRRLVGLELEGVASVPAADVGHVGTVDLVVVTSARWARRAAADGALTRVLRRASAVYAQSGILDGAVAMPRPSIALWLGVADGEVSLAAGRRDDAAIALLRRPGAATAAAPRRTSASRLARQVRQRPRLREHVGTLAGLGSPSPGTGVPVPAYVRDIAEAAGERVDGFRVALAAPGDYPSRKPVLALFAPGARSPRYVVKLAHDVALNDRLENEARALRTLAALGIGDAATVPRAAFVGQHAGHAVLGQTAIVGVPFRQATSATPDCPAARAALSWLTELGARTADRTVAEPPQVAAALGELLERFAHVYRPTAGEREALAAQVAAVAASRRPFPLVFQHGDAGTWNLLVTADGRPGLPGLGGRRAPRHAPVGPLLLRAQRRGRRRSGIRHPRVARGVRARAARRPADEPRPGPPRRAPRDADRPGSRARRAVAAHLLDAPRAQGGNHAPAGASRAGPVRPAAAPVPAAPRCSRARTALRTRSGRRPAAFVGGPDRCRDVAAHAVRLACRIDHGRRPASLRQAQVGAALALQDHRVVLARADVEQLPGRVEQDGELGGGQALPRRRRRSRPRRLSGQRAGSSASNA